MRLFKDSILLLCVLITFVGCASKKAIYLNEEYPKNGSTSSFAVLPFNQDWFEGAATKDMYGQEIEFFYQALSPSFSSNTPNRVNVIQSELFFENESFQPATLTDNKSSFKVTLPPDSLLNSFPERYVYFFEDYGFKLLQKAGERVSFAYLESESQLALQFSTKFYLYDKSNSEVISWGKIADNTDIYGRPKFLDYLKVLTKVSQQILLESPFQAIQ